MKYRYTVDQLDEIWRCPWLSDRERDVFELYYRRGWAIEDIAAELYCSRSTINNILRSIRGKVN